MRFYLLDRLKPSRSTGWFNDEHRWDLPGVICPMCGAGWGGCGEAYPCVDLSNHPERAKFEERSEGNFDHYAYLRELVRPLVPSDAPLQPGTALGPLVGDASGTFGPAYMGEPWMLLMHADALERLQAEGMRGLSGGRTELRFEQRPQAEVLELQIVPTARLHPSCLPPNVTECQKCGRLGVPWPKKPILDAASLPMHLDLFRLRKFATMIVCTERFADTLDRLRLADEVVFHEMPVR
jgi:uncharacterized double-CXXCG motif protein